MIGREEAAGAAPAPTAAIRARGLARRFGARWALNGVDLTVEWSEATAVVGPNGSGKTTLLRVLAGALTPTRGRALVAGNRLREEGRAVRSAVGLLAGDAYLYDDLTAVENLRFAARMCGGDPSDEALGRVLERVGLTGSADRPIRVYSSGMRKRLALGRMLAMDPRVLLLDEPYANLDGEGADLVDRVIGEWIAGDRAVVLATHRTDRAADVCHDVVHLKAGRRIDLVSRAAGAEPAAPPAVMGAP